MALVVRVHGWAADVVVQDCCDEPDPAFEIGGDGPPVGVRREQRMVCMNCHTLLVLLRVMP